MQVNVTSIIEKMKRSDSVSRTIICGEQMQDKRGPWFVCNLCPRDFATKHNLSP